MKAIDSGSRVLRIQKQRGATSSKAKSIPSCCSIFVRIIMPTCCC
jgi:hypothetical protein